MKDIKEIEIAQIANLKMIYCYNLEPEFNSSKPLLEIKINYGKEKHLAYNYRSPYFNKFLIKIFSCYQEEGRKARLLGDYTNEIFTHLLNNKPEEVSLEYIEEALFHETLLEKNILNGYLRDIAKNFLSFHLDLQRVKILDVVGFKTKYFISYEYLGTQQTISASVIQNGEDEYSFVMQIYDLDHDIKDTCRGTIKHNEERVYVNWQSDITTVQGYLLYSPEKTYNEATLTLDGKTIDLEQMKREITEDEKNMLNSYCSLFYSGTFDCIIPTVENQYLLQKTTMEDSFIMRKDYLHMTLSDDFVYIKRKEIHGKYSKENDLFFPILEEKENIVILPLQIDCQRHLFLQHHYLENKYMTGDYINHQANKYSYELVKIVCNKDFKDVFQIWQITNITNDLETLQKVEKKLIYEKEEAHVTL